MGNTLKNYSKEDAALFNNLKRLKILIRSAGKVLKVWRYYAQKKNGSVQERIL